MSTIIFAAALLPIAVITYRFIRKKTASAAANSMMFCNVESVLGVSEFSLVQIPAAERANLFLSKDGTNSFIHKTTGQTIPFGQFQTVKLVDLKERVQSMASAVDGSGERNAPPPTLKTVSGIDIGQLQATLQTNDRAMVQVASNFNCLENGGVRASPNSGFLVDGACADYTQGPAATFGPLSCYLYRAHFVPTTDKDKMTSCGQTEDRFVNLLQHVSQYFGVPVNGKLQLKGVEQGISDVDHVANEVCIGLHTDCPVMFGRKDGERSPFHNAVSSSGNDSGTTYPLVDQVLTASINLGSYGKMGTQSVADVGENGDPKQAEDLMVRTLLRASYEATYLAAIVQRRKTLLLTLVGGGSFGNPIHIVVEEMERAHELWAGHPASQLEKVQLCLYSKKDEHEVEKYLGAKTKK